MNKWRLATLWILGFTTFMTVMNLVYAVFKGTLVGGNTFYPFVVGNIIGEVTGIQYFWISAILAASSTGVMLLVVYSPFAPRGRLSFLQPICRVPRQGTEHNKASQDEAVTPIQETLQAIHTTVQASVEASAQANAVIIKNMAMDYQLFREEMRSSMERQENFNQLITLLTLTTMFDRNTPQAALRPASPALLAMNQALPPTFPLDPTQYDTSEPEPVNEDNTVDDTVEKDDITETEVRTIIRGPVRVKATSGRNIFRRTVRSKKPDVY